MGPLKTAALLVASGLLLVTGYSLANLRPQTSPNLDLDYPVNGPTVIAQDLKTPWELVFLPDGSLLVTEREGNLVYIRPNQTLSRIPIPDVTQTGEGGLMGMALDPNSTKNNYLYLYYTVWGNAGTTNKVDRFSFNNGNLSERYKIIDNIPGGSVHNGGRISFGPDGFLYIGTGDSGRSDLAQDTESLAGKILRLNKDGTIPADNPFLNPVYSYGHRNVQGLVWDDQKRLWATEHGPSGSQIGDDELNLIEKGKKYGWPLIKGSGTGDGLVSPVVSSGSNETWAPAGAVFKNGSIFFGGLRGQTLYEVKINNNPPVLTRHLNSLYGRIRIVAMDDKKNLYIGTSNTDGRGTPQTGDDKIVRLSGL